LEIDGEASILRRILEVIRGDSMEPIQSLLNEVLESYPWAREGVFAGHPIARLLRDRLPSAVRSIIEDRSYLVKGSAGEGGWADTPWVAIMDSTVTETVKQGHYVVYLFRGDGAGVYLSLNQGITEIHDSAKSRHLPILETSAKALEARLWRADLGGLQLGRIDLAARGWRTEGYESGNVVAKLYRKGSLPKEIDLVDDLMRFLELYRMTTEVVDERTEQDSPIVEWTGGSEVERAALRWHQRADRNSRLVADAKRAHGFTCQVCGFNFQKAYGEVGIGFIEAHHLTPFSELGGRPTALNPRDDFAVVCSNCHRMLHRELPPLTVVELRGRLTRAQATTPTGGA
jgi:5-methylcytosine-specific restriction protein A